MPEPGKIFFAYSRSDSRFVVRLANDLRNEGQGTWVDQLNIPMGARWDEVVEAALKACPCLVAVLTPASAGSQNVLDEVSYALEEKKTIIPILLSPCTIPFRLKRLQYIDFTGEYGPAFHALHEALRRLEFDGARQQGDRRSALPRELECAQRSSAHADTGVGATDGAATERHGNAGRRAISRKAVASALLLIIAVVASAYFALSRLPGDSGAGHSATAPPPAIEPSRPQIPGTDRPDPNAERPPPSAAPGAALPPSPGTPDPANRQITDAQGREFVDRYLALASAGNVSGMLKMYDERVDYHDRGIVGTDYIFKDKQSYFRRWPDVRARLSDEVVVKRAGKEDAATLSFGTAYQVHSPERGETRSGTARNEFQVRRVAGELKIVAEQQRVDSK